MGTQLGSILEPSWLPKSKKDNQNGGPRRIDFCTDFGIDFCAIWAPSWPPSWNHLGDKMALKFPKRGLPGFCAATPAGSGDDLAHQHRFEAFMHPFWVPTARFPHVFGFLSNFEC